MTQKNPRCSLCTPGVRPLAFCSRHALALVNRTVSAADLERLADTPTLPFPEPGAAPWAHDGDQIPGWYYDGTGVERTIIDGPAL